MDLFSEGPDTEINLPAIYKIPVEIWDKILFGYLNPGEDLHSLYNASVKWSNILEDTKVGWMFVQIFPLIAQQLTRKDVLKCREVCKQWRYGVDHFLENNVVQRPWLSKCNTTKNHESFQDWFISEKLEYNFRSSKQKDNLLQQAVHHPNNPIVGKSVSIQYDQTLPQQHVQEVGNCQSGIQSLEIFGCHIHFLRIRFTIDQPQRFLEKFVQLFEIAALSNLKKLEINFWSTETDLDESIVGEQLQLYINSLIDKQKRFLPDQLETLNITGIYGFCSSKLHQIFISLFSQNLKSFTKWNTKPFVFPPNIQFTNLSHLAICVGSPETLKSLLALNSPLQRLCLHFTINTLNCNKLFIEAINSFQDTLRNLELHLAQIDSLTVEKVTPFVTPGNLRLPRISTLTFNNNLPPSFNFISGLKTLQYLHLHVYPRYITKDQFLFVNYIYPEQLDLNLCLPGYYLKAVSQQQSLLYKSNVWTSFTRLKVLSMSGMKGGKNLELRRDIFEKLK